MGDTHKQGVQIRHDEYKFENDKEYYLDSCIEPGKYIKNENAVFLFNKIIELKAGSKNNESNLNELLSKNPYTPYFKHGNIVYTWNILEIVEKPLSFEILNEDYFKDEKNVYFRGTKMEGVDVETFQFIYHSNEPDPIIYYTKDEFNVYYEGTLIPGVHLKTFQVLDDETSKDKYRIYNHNSIIQGDRNHFSGLGELKLTYLNIVMSIDKNYCYIKSLSTGKHYQEDINNKTVDTLKKLNQDIEDIEIDDFEKMSILEENAHHDLGLENMRDELGSIFGDDNANFDVDSHMEKNGF